MDLQTSSIPCTFHPELVSSEVLINKIRERCPKILDLTFLSREKIIKLYYQMVIPLGQRQYCQKSWRGRMLAGKRNKTIRNLDKVDSNKSTSTKKKTARSSTTLDLDLDKIIINDRVKGIEKQKPVSESILKAAEPIDGSRKKITLKRPQTQADYVTVQQSTPPSPSASPSKRVKITWP